MGKTRPVCSHSTLAWPEKSSGLPPAVFVTHSPTTLLADELDTLHDENIMLKIGDHVTYNWRDGALEGKGVLDDFIGLACPCNQVPC